MKKNLLLALLLVSAMGLSAQMYVGLGFGYHMAAQDRALGTSYATNGDASNIYGSMGQGVIPALKFGYMLDDNWGIEFGFSYLMGGEQTVYEDLQPSMYDSYTEKITAVSNMIRLSPQLVFKTEMGIYFRAGLIIPVGGKTMVSRTVDVEFNGTTSNTSVEIENHGAFTAGFDGAIGYGFSLNDNMTIFGELEYVGLRIYGATATVTKYEVDGKDKLPDLKTIQIETEYVDEVLTTDNTSEDEPFKDLKSSSPYSSLGINFGIIYHFN